MTPTALVLLLLLPAADPDPAADTKALTPVLRKMLLEHLPTPVAETSHDWGRQKEVTVGVALRRRGLLNWEADPRKALKNDGHWHKTTVVARDPEKSLLLSLENVRPAGDGKLTFDARLAADADLKFEQQIWVAGVRAMTNETRARCRVSVVLKAEVTQRLDYKPGGILPTAAVVRVRVTEAKLGYSDLVVEHTLGVGGDAAKKLGEAAHALVKRFKPGLEAELLAKADAAVVKAADTKDVRVEFAKWFGTK